MVVRLAIKKWAQGSAAPLPNGRRFPVPDQALSRLRGDDYFVALPVAGMPEVVDTGCAGGDAGVTGEPGAAGAASVGA